MKFAILENNVVTEILNDLSDEQIQEIGTTKTVRDVTDISNIDIGWYECDGTLHPVSGSILGNKKITRLAFQNRLTDSENMAILAYMDGAGVYKYAVKMLMNKLSMATYIDLNRSDTQAGMQLLIAAGLLTPTRYAAVLNNPITETEIYHE